MHPSAERSIVFRAAALALLLLLAGCGAVPAGPPGGTPSPTVTPVPVPETTPTATPEGRVVPGVTRDGVVDPAALAEAHEAAVGERYRLRVDWRARAANGTLLARSRQRALVTPTVFRASLTTTGAPAFAQAAPAPNVTVWANASRLAERTRAAGTVRYRALDTPDDRSSGGTAEFYGSLRRPLPDRPQTDLFAAVETIPVARLETGAGTAYVVSGTTVTDSERLARVTELQRPRNVTLRAVIDQRGLVRDLRLDYDGLTPDGERITVRRTVRYGTVSDDAVQPPDWVRRTLAGENTTRTGSGRERLLSRR